MGNESEGNQRMIFREEEPLIIIITCICNSGPFSSTTLCTTLHTDEDVEIKSATFRRGREGT